MKSTGDSIPASANGWPEKVKPPCPINTAGLQARNQVGERIHVYGVSCPPKYLPSGKTRKINLSSILDSAGERDSSKCPIAVRIGDNLITVECPTAEVLLLRSRIVFSLVKENGKDILKIEGIRENTSDWLLRLKFFGFLRSIVSDKSFEIARVPLSRVNESRSSTQVEIQKSEVKIQSERRIQESEKKIQASEKKIQESEKMIQESEKRILESDQESEVKIRESERRIQESERKIQESERRIQESERRIQESERKIPCIFTCS